MDRSALALTALLLVGAVAGAAPATAADAPDGARPDPDTDVVGWENGYWYDDPVDVDQSDGLSDAELEAYVARAMARVEYLRDAEFRSPVPVETMTREEWQSRSRGSASAAHAAWNDQVWEAMLVVGEDANASTVLSETLGGAVAGFYSPGADEIVVVTPADGERTIDNATLVHELTHALQDQRYDLTDSRYSAETQDGSLASDGIVEGVASYVERTYAARCGAEWDCVATPDGGDAGGPPSNWGVLVTLFFPYSDGAPYVQSLRDAGGWAAVDERMRDPPASSEQVLHHVEETPRPMPFEDTSTAAWERWPEFGENGSDTVGEASIFAGFWYQSRAYGAGTVDWREIGDVSGQYDRFDYGSPPSDGWANDRVVPYHGGNGSNVSYGYVWRTSWDTTRDAQEFYDAYTAVLRGHDARKVGKHTWVVPDGPFADAFHVSRDGRTVEILNAPTVENLSGIRSGYALEERPQPPGVPGFGPLVALVALAAVGGLYGLGRYR